MPERKRTSQQNRIIHSLVGKWKFTPDDKAELVFDITNGRTCSTKELTFDEANVMIHRLDGRPVVAQPLAGKSPRTVNYHRQKTGVEQIATPTHKDLMRSLWRKVEGRTDEGLARLSARVNQGLENPRTTKQVNRVIEAIKSMNARARISDAFQKDEQEAV